MTLHYLSDGGMVLAFARNKQLFYVPVVFILKVTLVSHMTLIGRSETMCLV